MSRRLGTDVIERKKLLTLADRMENADLLAAEFGEEAKLLLLPKGLGMEGNPIFSLDACADIMNWILPGWSVSLNFAPSHLKTAFIQCDRSGAAGMSKAGVCAAWLSAMCRAVAAPP